MWEHLSAFGFLALLSHASYASLGDTWSNIAVGVASALIDNIPIMFAVLTMNPDMSQGQWLLVTLTAGRRRIAPLDWIRGGRGSHGSGTRHLHILRASEMDLGDRARLCGFDLRAFPHQRRKF